MKVESIEVQYILLKQQTRRIKELWQQPMRHNLPVFTFLENKRIVEKDLEHLFITWSASYFFNKTDF